MIVFTNNVIHEILMFLNSFAIAREGGQLSLVFKQGLGFKKVWHIQELLGPCRGKGRAPKEPLLKDCMVGDKHIGMSVGQDVRLEQMRLPKL